MYKRIFISYRLSDQPGFVGRLYDRLTADSFGDDVFMDIHGIPAGHDFAKLIEDHVKNSDVVLAVIGDRWLTAASADGKRRLDDPADFVRREIMTGLKVGNRVLPVLLDTVPPLRPHELPEGLHPLAAMQALRLTHKSFDADAQHIIEQVRSALEAAAAKKGSTKRIWNIDSFLEAAQTARGSELRDRFARILSWAEKHFSVRWGSGVKYGTFQVFPRGAGTSVMYAYSDGTIAINFQGLEKMGALPTLQAREMLIDRLNTIQGLSIIKSKAQNDLVYFTLSHVGDRDFEKLLALFETELSKVVLIS